MSDTPKRSTLQKRRRSARIGSNWDHFARTMKVALPALAAVLLAAIVTWPLTQDKELSFVLAKDQVDVSEERLRMEHPVYTGQDSNGRPFRIEADRAVQKTSSNPTVRLTGLRAHIELADGTARMSAADGIYDLDRQQLRVIGGMQFAARGYRVDAASAVLDLPTRTLTGPQGLTGQGPLGTFVARRFRVDVNQRTVEMEQGHMRIVPTRD